MRDVPLTRRDFQRLAELRAREAGALLRSRNPIGAYYLSGYAIECALKACIAKQGRRHEFPLKADYIRRLYTHDLKELLRLAEIEDQLEDDMRKNAALARNWFMVKDWTEESRYKSTGLNGRDLHSAIVGPDGVLLWIKQRW
jgi:HEPN domain-containing protein